MTQKSLFFEDKILKQDKDDNTDDKTNEINFVLARLSEWIKKEEIESTDFDL